MLTGGRDGVRVAAVVPVRGLPAGKSRLAAVLRPDQRNRLVRAMLSDVVRMLRSVAAVESVTVLSRDAAAAREATRLGADFLQEPPGALGLNRAFVYAQTEHAEAEALLLVPADLPLVMRGDVEALLDALPQGRGVVVAQSRDGGTNGLLLRPPTVIPPMYGSGSAGRHVEAAEEAGVAVARVEGERWALDIDTPEDLVLAVAMEGCGDIETLRYLRSAELADVIRRC